MLNNHKELDVLTTKTPIIGKLGTFFRDLKITGWICKKNSEERRTAIVKINEIASNYNIEKVLFCARDCAILSKVYTKYYSQRPSEYIDISRLSIMKVMPEKYAYDILKRFIFRYWDNNHGLRFCPRKFDVI